MRPTLDIQVDHRVSGQTETTSISPGDAADAATYFERCRPWHEAAHALVALHLGLTVRYLTLDRAEAAEATGDPTAGGCAAFETFRGESGVLAAVAFAGIASDSSFGFPGATLEGDPTAATAAAATYAARDFEAFRRLLPHAGAQRQAAMLAHDILRDRRADVIRIGRALLERGRMTERATLTGDEVRALLNGL
jgi:hypothetical protein